MGDLIPLPVIDGGAPWPAERRRWWLLWAACPGLGWWRLRRLEQAHGSLAAAWSVPVAELGGLPGFGPRLLASVEAHRRRWGAEPLRPRPGSPALRRVLVPGDPAWPPALRALERPPVALHWRGRGSLWPLLRRRRAVAVVGTRRPSRHGLVMAEALGSALAEAGWPVVSGLAEGIDAAVHHGCLAQGGSPVGVLGTPLDRVYPLHHRSLQHSVEGRGLLVSELSPGASVHRGHFAARNRLQVSLARAVVVVECPASSGALHSANLAWEQGLPLWVVPADAAKRSAAGSNRLLQQGATPLLDPADLIAQLGEGPLPARGPRPRSAAGLEAVGAGLPAAADQALLAALGQGSSLEHLCRALGRPAAELSCQLLRLELAGRVRAEPGLHWRPARGGAS